MSNRDGRKRVLFVCIANACRSPMAEAIARIDAPDAMEASSAGLEPIGYVALMTKQTLMKNGCWVEGLESKEISPEIWEQADIVVNLSGRLRERAFREYSKVEDWEIEDPFGKSPEAFQEVFGKIRLRVGKLAQRCREETASRVEERRRCARRSFASPLFICLNGEHNATVLNISEDGLALSSEMSLPDRPLQNLRIQFLESKRLVEAACQIAWRSKFNKEVGIQFIGLGEEERQHVRKWISERASSDGVQAKTERIYEEPPTRLETPAIAQLENIFRQPSTSSGVMHEREETAAFPSDATPALPVADIPATGLNSYAPARKPPEKKRPQYRPKRTSFAANSRAARKRWRTFASAAVVIGLGILVLKWATTERDVRSETIAAFQQKAEALSEAVKPAAPPPAVTTPSVRDLPSEKAEAETPVDEAQPAEKAGAIQDISPKKSSRPTYSAKKPLQKVLAKTPIDHPTKNLHTAGRASKEPLRVAANLNASPVEKTRQLAMPNLSAAPPQPEARIAPIIPAPTATSKPPSGNPNNDVRPAEPKPEESLPPPARQPVVPVNITGAVSILTNPYPSLRISDLGSKKHGQAASLQLGHLVSRVEPAYPEEAKREGIQGTVKLHAVIDRHGSVEAVQSVEGAPVLAAAAMNAVRQWRYSETLLAGKSVETEEDIAVTFRLSNQPTPTK